MSDIPARSTTTLIATRGVATGLVRPGVDSDMGRIVTNAQRLSVAPYAVSRGAFLPANPLIQVTFSVNGVSNRILDASWSSLADQSWSLFDPEDADLLWPSLSPTGRVLSASATGVAEKVYGVRGDRSSRRIYTAVRSDPGGSSSMDTMQGSGMWMATAFRLLPGATGGLLTVQTTLGLVTVSCDGRRFVFSVDGTVYGSHPRDPQDSTVTCIGITVYESLISLVIREGVTTSTYTYVTNVGSDPMYPLSMTVGGPDSPQMLVYVIAQGDADQMIPVVSLITGYLSC